MSVTLLVAVLHLGAACLPGAVFYNLRDARFFGDTTGRETLASGTFTPASSEQLPATYTTGGANPTVFNGTATNQGAPFRLGVSNQISAGAGGALTSNFDFVTPVPFVSLVQSGLTENGVVITGGTGTGYLLPTFRIRGSFTDNHPAAFASVAMCAGIDSCAVSGVANSTGPLTVDTLFTPAIGGTTDFTFGVPFTLFFFISADISSFTNGSLAAGGELSSNFANGLELVGVAVVDANGNPIPGAVIDSEFLNGNQVPEPGTLGMLCLAGLAGAVLRPRRGGVSSTPRRS